MSKTHWHKEEIFHTGESFYNDIFNHIQKAEKTIHIEAHYFDNKYLGKCFTKHLVKALERGIEVYLILDGMSPVAKPNSILKHLLIFKGARVRIFNPLFWRSFSFRGLLTLNHRTHKKLILIDKKTAYIGSYNIDTRQLSSNKGSESWRDCGVKVQGPGISQILEGFWDTWHYCHYPWRKKNPFKISKPSKSHPVRLNHHNSWRKYFFDDIITRVNEAKTKVWITNPYFVPDQKMIRALRDAKQRGVDVIIVLPQKSDLKFFPLINFIFIKSLIKFGIKVYEYRPTILHAKILIIDQWVMMGSSNLNSRSQKHDWELDIVLNKNRSLKELEQRFLIDLNSSTALNHQGVIKRFGLQGLASPIFVSTKYFL